MSSTDVSSTSSFTVPTIMYEDTANTDRFAHSLTLCIHTGQHDGHFSVVLFGGVVIVHLHLSAELFQVSAFSQPVGKIPRGWFTFNLDGAVTVVI